MGTLAKVLLGSIAVIVPLVAAAFFIPLDFPLLPRQLILTSWGVGAILLAEPLLFGPGWDRALRAIGFVAVRWPAVLVALLVSLPMWLFLPVYGWLSNVPVGLNPHWPAILIGVVLVNGITEEAIHRGFVFGHLRRERSFLAAASISSAIFAVQHLYLVLTIGVPAGFAAVLLAALLAFPLALMFERGGNSIGAPAILHTSSNAPIMLFVLPPSLAGNILLPHMAVVLVSIYLCFPFGRYLGPPSSAPLSASNKSG